jgi:hypothetical protein
MRKTLLGFASVAVLLAGAWTADLSQAAAQGGAGGAGGGAQRGGGARGAGGGGAGGAGSQTIPRWPDGKVMLRANQNETLLWYGAFGISGTNIPYQPWARAMAGVRQRNQLEPHARCKPSGAVREFQTPYGVDIVDMPEMKRVFIMDVGGPHTYRIIYTDGREHPKDLTPSYYGHSIGSWDGDTFVVDTVGYNERFWVDRGDTATSGFVHTNQLHTIEKFTRAAYNSIRYELTIDDPGAYTEKWTAGNYALTMARDNQAQELFEYICQDNNQGGELMVGTMSSVSRKTTIIP